MNAKGKSVDTTFLSIENAEERGFIHRDYIAHCLRWSHVIKQLFKNNAWKTAKILDIGCGRELPFAKTLYSSRLIVKKYSGVDVGKINPAPFNTGKFPLVIYPETDFLKLDLANAEIEFSHIISFEMLEHVEPRHAIDILKKIWQWSLPQSAENPTRIYISTPIWNGCDCADNHVNEMKYHALGWMLEEIGFHIVDVFGTFASQSDYVHKMDPAHKEAFEDLKSYYDSNLLSCIFAPFYPEQSRNAMWALEKGEPKRHRLFTAEQLAACKPWGSSTNNADMGKVWEE